MTNTLQKHIADSLERFDNSIKEDYSGKNSIGMQYVDIPVIKVKDFIRQEFLQLLSIARGEVEKLNSFETEDFVFPTAIKRQDVLDTLTISNQSKNN